MIRSIYITIFLSLSVFASSEEDIYYAELSKYVSGLSPSYDIVTKHIHPGAYLGTLKVADTRVILGGAARYQLARNLLDVHYLCQALSHQGYNFEPDDYPILKLAAKNFKGFDEACRGEGGYWSYAWADFFKSGEINWSVTSTYKNQTIKK